MISQGYVNRATLLERKLSDAEVNYFTNYGVKIEPNACVLGALPIIYNPFVSSIVIGSHVVLNSDSSQSFAPIVSPVKFALGKDARILIGNYCDLNGCSLSAYESIEIGNYVQIGPATWITDTDLHSLDAVTRRRQLLGEPYDWAKVKRKPVVICDDVWIGASCIILKGVTIGHGAVIGAGSVVTNDIPPYCAAAGNPARVIQFLEDVPNP